MYTDMSILSNPAAHQASVSRVTPDLLADALRDEIASGAFAPGTAIRQAEIATRFGVSRIPVREALRRLEAEGLLVVHANRGAFVRSFDREEVREIYDLRLMIETDLLRRAVERMTPSEIGTIEIAAAAAAAGAGGPHWRELDNRFHLALYAPAKRAHQSSMVAALRGTVIHYRSADARLALDPRCWLEDHEKLLAACRAGDAEGAAQILRDHLEHAAERSLSSFDGGAA